MTYLYPTTNTAKPAQRIGDFLGSLGVNTAISSWITADVNTTNMLTALTYVGATAIRDGLTVDGTHLPQYAGIVSNGIKLLLVSPTDADSPTLTVADCVAAGEAIEKMATGALIGLEHPNEPSNQNYTYNAVTSSNSASPGFLPIANFASAFYTAAKQSAYLNNVPLVHVSLAAEADPLDSGLSYLSLPWGYVHTNKITNASTASGNAVLNFANNTAVQVGAYIYGTNVAAGAKVSSSTSTTVTMSAVSTGIIASGATIRFGARVPDNTIFSDIANIHVYPMIGASIGHSSQSIDPAVGNFYAQALSDDYWNPTGSGQMSGPTQTQALNYRRWVTEYGYPTAGVGANSNAVDQATAGKNLMTAWLNAWQSGYDRFFIYRIYDDGASASTASNSFGLYSWTGSGATFAQTAKSAATYLHNMTTILGDTSFQRNTFPTASLSYSLSNMPSPGGTSQLFQRVDGTYFLILWNNINNWNKTTGASITIAATTVTLTVPQSMTIKVYDPTLGTSSQSTTTGTSTTVSLADYPMIVSLI